MMLSWLNRMTESCNFLTDSTDFSTEEIMGVQNFNFAPNNGLKGGSEHFFQCIIIWFDCNTASNYCDRKKNSDAVNYR